MRDNSFEARQWVRNALRLQFGESREDDELWVKFARWDHEQKLIMDPELAELYAALALDGDHECGRLALEAFERLTSMGMSPGPLLQLWIAKMARQLVDEPERASDYRETTEVGRFCVALVGMLRWKFGISQAKAIEIVGDGLSDALPLRGLPASKNPWSLVSQAVKRRRKSRSSK